MQRWRAGVVLGIALLMVLVGLSILKSSLDGVAYLVYWLVCIGLIFLALIFAFTDLQQVRHRFREEQRELIENAMDGLPDDTKDE